jgi:tetratricopeptide (TPR) repeat protein
MQRSRKLELMTIPMLAIFLLAIPAIAQEQALAENVEAAPGADLTEVNALVSDSKYAEAESLLAILQQEFPDDPILLLLRGELLVALGRHDEAQAVLRHGVAVDPDRPRMNFNLGTALASTGQRKPALEAFGRELEINQDDAVRTLAHLNRSLLFEQERDWAGAVQALEAVLEIQPSRTEIYGDLVALYIQSGQTAEALETMERGVGAGFASSRHYYSLGARLYRDERYADAVSMLTRAVELEPSLSQAERSLAAALEKVGREEESLEHLRRYLELNPDAPDAAAASQKLKSAENR